MGEPFAARGQLRDALTSRLRAHPTILELEVEVHDGDPGRYEDRDQVFPARISSNKVEFPFMQGGAPLIIDDDFTITWAFMAGVRGDEPVDADRRVLRMVAAFAGICARVEDWIDDIPDIADFDVSAADGPDGVRTTEGALSFFEIETSATARYDPL